MTKKKIKLNKNNKEFRDEKTETQELKNQLARALADYDNLKKRVEAEKKLWLKFAKEQLLVEILPAFDNIELAQRHLKDQGLGIAISQFSEIFKANGVEEVETKNFDEALHEAVEVESGGQKGKISEVVLRGYRFADGDIIRPAKVKVYNGNAVASSVQKGEK